MPLKAIDPYELPTEASQAQLLDVLGSEASGHIGGYRLLELVGEGAMGHVYRAEHALLGRLVAIKILLPELTQDEASTARFLAEARLVNQIEHDHVIAVTDFARDANGTPWFVMELLDGADLGALISTGPLALRRSLEIVRQLCGALTAVHAAGIVHRDVKPENTFVSTRDGSEHVTLIDFGIARLPDDAHADPPILAVEGMAGTPAYMAPEQILSGHVDFRLDLYAVGGVLFELVVGRTPFRRKDMRVMLGDVLYAMPPVPSSLAFLPEAIRSELDELILSCLAKEPSKRPSSARAIAALLGELMGRLDAPRRAPPAPLPAPPPQSAATPKPFKAWLRALAASVVLWLVSVSGDDRKEVHVASPAIAFAPAQVSAPPPAILPSDESIPAALAVDRSTPRSSKSKRGQKLKKIARADLHRDAVLNPFE